MLSSLNSGRVLLSQNGFDFPLSVSLAWKPNEQWDSLALSIHFLASSNSSHSGEGTGMNFERKVFPQLAASEVNSFSHDATDRRSGGRSSHVICCMGELHRSWVPCKLCRTSVLNASDNTGLECGLTQGSKWAFRQSRKDWDCFLGWNKQTRKKKKHYWTFVKQRELNKFLYKLKSA